LKLWRKCLTCGRAVPTRIVQQCQSCRDEHDARLAAIERAPTPEEIRQRCAEVQATWDDTTEQTRAGTGARKPVQFPAIRDTRRPPRI
jgi:hypothetical protein